MAAVRQNGYKRNYESGRYGDPIYTDIRETDILGDSDPEPDTDPLEVLEGIEGGDPDFTEEYLTPPVEHRLIGDRAVQQQQQQQQQQQANHCKLENHQQASPAASLSIKDSQSGHEENSTAATKDDLLNWWGSTNMSLGNAFCARCGQGFGKEEEIVNSNGEVWHTDCFVGALTLKRIRGKCAKCKRKVDLSTKIINYSGQLWHPQCFSCAQCFRVFPDGIFYEFEGRKYCEDDFKMLFAPFCSKTDCNNFIVGRVIKAMNANWHPECFLCEICTVCLADSGYFKNANRALCKECNDRENAAGKGKYICHKCKSVIEEGHIKWKGEAYHPYHFNCKNCKIELTSDARELNGELYCLRCHDKMGIPICGACRRPIDGERIVHALGKSWHVEHFVCAQCEKPFLGTRHYEKKGLAYCETHYHQLFGNICFTCNSVIAGDVFSALNKAWCVDHFACYICEKKMSQKTKFYEFDLKPVCKHCYEKFPSELKKRQKKAYENSPKK